MTIRSTNSCKQERQLFRLSQPYRLPALILAARSGPYSRRSYTSRMTVSTYPDWEFRDPRLCHEDLFADRGQQPKGYSKLVGLTLASPPPAAAPPGGSTGVTPCGHADLNRREIGASRE